MLIDAASCHSELTAGRPSTLWSATAEPEHEVNEVQEENDASDADAGELVTE